MTTMLIMGNEDRFVCIFIVKKKRKKRKDLICGQLHRSIQWDLFRNSSAVPFSVLQCLECSFIFLSKMVQWIPTIIVFLIILYTMPKTPTQTPQPPPLTMTTTTTIIIVIIMIIMGIYRKQSYTDRERLVLFK